MAKLTQDDLYRAGLIPKPKQGPVSTITGGAVKDKPAKKKKKKKPAPPPPTNKI